ncbi:MAG: SDR family NAD(P)-dependent oxidoreductase [Janthinobacterium lividum]
MSTLKPGTAVVTGGTGGIGRWIALGLAQAGYTVVLVGRDRVRGEAVRAWVSEQAAGTVAELMVADLSSLAATQALGRNIAKRHPRVSLLVNNAGVFRARRERTAEGHDMVLAVNHLSPFVLTRELEGPLRAGAPSRIVTVGSSTSDRARIDPDNLELEHRWGMVRAYSQSKLAVMMATFEWARRLDGSGVVANVVHPGTVATGLVRTPGIIGLVWRLMALWSRSEQEGADTPLHVALAPDLAGVTGKYFKERRIAEPNRLARDPELAGRVWRATEGLVTLA